MMSPNRAMAQAGSGGVVVDRPTVLLNTERIENFDITTHIDGIIDEDGDLELLQDEKYIAPDGVTYTCVTNDGCWITPTEGGGGKAFYGSQFDITYPDDIGSSDQAVDDVAAAVDDVVADTADDPVVDARPKVLNDQDRIENYDVTTKTDGEVTLDGDLLLDQGDKYTAPDGVVYTCSSDDCAITPTEGGGAKANHDSQFDITYPNDIGSSDQAVDDVADDDSPRFLVKGERMETFDVTTVTDGVVYFGGVQLFEDSKYTAPDGVVYTCTTRVCVIDSLGENHLGILSYRPR